jgi:hypothetical protein
LDPQWWHTVYRFLAIAAAFVTFISLLGTWYFSSKLDAQRNKTIAELTIKAQLDEAQKAEMREQLAAMPVIAQPITKLESGDVMVLNEEPDPQSIRIIVGPLMHFPTEGYGYRVEGRQIFVMHPNTLAQIQQRLPRGVTVEYRRRVKPLSTP